MADSSSPCCANNAVALQLNATADIESLRQFWQQVLGSDDQTIIRAVKNVTIKGDAAVLFVESASFGRVQLTLTLATSLGDNFMSDGYLTTAKLEHDGTELRAFTKVIFL